MGMIYTSAIMMVLRFWFAGPIVEKLTPSVCLQPPRSWQSPGFTFLASRRIGHGFCLCHPIWIRKNLLLAHYSWRGFRAMPERWSPNPQCNCGIGMLAVGILGGPVIGKMTEDSIKSSVIEATSEEKYSEVSKDSVYFLGAYTAIDSDAVGKLQAEEKTRLRPVSRKVSKARLRALQSFLSSCSFATSS